MEDQIKMYLAQRRAEGLAQRSLGAYRDRLDAALRHARSRGCATWADFTPEDVRAWLDGLAARGLKRSSRQSYLIALRQFLAVLQADGKILRNPARHCALSPDRRPALPPPPLEEAAVHDLLARLPRETTTDLRNRAHLELLYGCGLRLAESCTLTVEDLDHNRRLLHVRAGKGGKDRLLPVMPTALAAVEDYLAVRGELLRGPDVGALFLSSQTGRPVAPITFRQWLARLGWAYGRHLHPHLFRHSIAVHLLRGGADIRHIQAFLGHVTMETTKIYLRMVPGRLREDYDEAMPAIPLAAQ